MRRSTSSGPITCARIAIRSTRSEEHTSELQSHVNLVCRLLLEKKKKKMFGLEAASSELRDFSGLSEPAREAPIDPCWYRRMQRMCAVAAGLKVLCVHVSVVYSF